MCSSDNASFIFYKYVHVARVCACMCKHTVVPEDSLEELDLSFPFVEAGPLLFPLCCELQASWLVSFQVVPPSILLSPYRTAGIIDEQH